MEVIFVFALVFIIVVVAGLFFVFADLRKKQKDDFLGYAQRRNLVPIAKAGGIRIPTNGMLKSTMGRTPVVFTNFAGAFCEDDIAFALLRREGQSHSSKGTAVTVKAVPSVFFTVPDDWKLHVFKDRGKVRFFSADPSTPYSTSTEELLNELVKSGPKGRYEVVMLYGVCLFTFDNLNDFAACSDSEKDAVFKMAKCFKNAVLEGATS